MVNQSENTLESKDRTLPNWISTYLSMNDVERIEAVVAKAESKTTGEIVPVIVHSCISRRPSLFVTGSILVLIFLVIAESGLISWLHAGDPLCVLAGVLVSLFGGWLLNRSSLFRRTLLHDDEADQLALLRAEVEFYRAGIGQTQSHTGILLFLALEERHAVVLADNGISSRLPPDTWNQVMSLMVQGIKSKKLADGMISAIEMCGTILAEHFPISNQINDQNELPNRLILKV